MNLAIATLVVITQSGATLVIPHADFALCEKTKTEAFTNAPHAFCVRTNYGPDRSPVQ